MKEFVYKIVELTNIGIIKWGYKYSNEYDTYGKIIYNACIDLPVGEFLFLETAYCYIKTSKNEEHAAINLGYFDYRKIKKAIKRQINAREKSRKMKIIEMTMDTLDEKAREHTDKALSSLDRLIESMK